MKKDTKKRNKKESNIVPFKKNAQVIECQDPVSVKEKETKKINNHCRKIFEELEEFGNTVGVSSGETWYAILFFAKQQAMYCTSYPQFKINDELSSKEITKNYAEFLDENFPELKIDHKPNKLH